MLYPEFAQYENYPDPDNSLVNRYKNAAGHIFYVEPGFYYALIGLKDKKLDDYERILDGIYQEIEANEKLVFTGNYETPFIEKEGYIYREITDITDPLHVFVEDKSRGSDYGD
ncbi:MAG: hypothetical protein K5694_02815 [Bacilli bacterium]|nr:hypothetical protein [Bacilli bacterium]